jgi:hypothetical protein
LASLLGLCHDGCDACADSGFLSTAKTVAISIPCLVIEIAKNTSNVGIGF